MACTVDVRDSRAVERFALDVADKLGRITVWINNAGVLGPTGRLRETSEEAWRECVEVNLLGVVNGTRAFLNQRAHQAVVINIASRAGILEAALRLDAPAIIDLTEPAADESFDGRTSKKTTGDKSP